MGLGIWSLMKRDVAGPVLFLMSVENVRLCLIKKTV